MNALAQPVAPDAEALHIRNAWKILPILALGYVLNTLGKTNVGLAALEMNEQLHFSAAVLGIGGGLFFVSYTLFELPSNIVLARVGARYWLSRILISWGIVSAAMALIQGATSFYLLRILLGIAEAGWYPGVLFYLTLWFPSSFRARATMIFYMAVPVSAVVGAPLSGAVLDLPDPFGIYSWQWLFILTGVSSLLLGLVALRVLKDSPLQAGWLSSVEIAAVTATLERDSEAAMISQRTPGKRGFASTVSLFAAVNFTGNIGLFATMLWLPKAIQSTGDYSNLAIGLITAFPFLFATFTLVLFARSSDRRRERKWHVVLPMFIAAAAMALATQVSAIVAFGLLIVAMMTALGCQGVAYAMFSEELGLASRNRRQLAIGLAAVTMAGNMAGFVGAVAAGQLLSSGGGYAQVIAMIACAFAVSALLLALFHRKPR